MRLLVINNLSSGFESGEIFEFARLFVKDGDEIVIRCTDGTTDIKTFLYDADDYDAVIVSGGDGTIASVAYELRDTGIALFPFPAGTANLLTVNLEYPTDVHELVSIVRRRITLDFDIGEIILSNGEKYGFTLIAGAGYDAKIMKDAEDDKKFLGQMAYFTSAFSNTNPQFSRIEMICDGKRIESSGVGILIINFSRIQFDLTVVHENNPRDGLFDIVILNTKDAYGLLPAFLAAFLDRGGDFPARSDAFEIYRASEIHVSADPPLLVQYDGEVTDTFTPFSIKMLPASSRFIVSDACRKKFSNG